MPSYVNPSFGNSQLPQVGNSSNKMDPALTGALIQTGGSLLSSGINYASTQRLNKKQREHQMAMFIKEQAANEYNWNKVNEYNLPKNQMQRYKDAGLNPHLIYGQLQQAHGIDNAKIGEWRPQTPQINLGNDIGKGLSTYYDIKRSQAALDFNSQQMRIMEEEEKIKKGQLAAAALAMEAAEFDLSQKRQLADTVVESAQLSAESKRAELSLKWQKLGLNEKQDERSELDMKIRALKMVEELSNNKLIREKVRAEINRIKTDTKYREKQLEELGRNIDTQYWLEDAIIETGVPKAISDYIQDKLTSWFPDYFEKPKK